MSWDAMTREVIQIGREHIERAHANTDIAIDLARNAIDDLRRVTEQRNRLHAALVEMVAYCGDLRELPPGSVIRMARDAIADAEAKS